MIVGAAVLPTAPLLAPGVAASLPEGYQPLRAAMDRTLLGLPHRELTVLVAASPSDAEVGVWGSAVASLAGIGRPDLGMDLPAGAGDGLGAAVGLPLREGHLPLDLAVLRHLVGGVERVLPLCVPAGASALELATIGDRIATYQREKAVVVCSGDLSAGLDLTAPLGFVAGARAWDDQVVDAVASGRLDGLSRLGPAEATRVGARGWAALAVLHGVCRTAKLGMMVRRYAAPRGVGYLVASGG